MTQKEYIPGSEWLYFKLYTGKKTGDRILTDYLYPLSKAFLEQGLITKFFFIRYADPDFHIRYRIHIENMDNYTKVFQMFHQQICPCVQNGSVNKVMCDTYVRELSRYEGITIDSAENIFFEDSIAIMEILSLLNDSDNDKEQERWQLSLRLVDDLLDAFDVSLEEKCKMTSNLCSAYKMEHGMTGRRFTKQLNDQYRSHRSLVSDAFHSDMLDAYEKSLANRRNKLIDIVHQRGLNSKPGLETLPSLLHMMMIRFFRSRARTYELVIYQYLEKFYLSEKARPTVSLSVESSHKDELPTTLIEMPMEQS